MAKSKAAKKAKKAEEAIKRWEEYFKEDKLENWQRLMVDLGVDGTFTSKTQCRQMISKTVWVNIFDFLDAVRDGTQVHRFPSQKALAQYSRDNDLIFPKKQVPKRTPMRALLAHILSY